MSDKSQAPITKLPDGSAFFTAEVMSKEEAMKLPPEKRPICYRISSEMYHAIFEAVGAASMCWNPRPSNEVFNSEQASKVAIDLCFKVANEITALHSRIERLTKAGDEMAQDLEGTGYSCMDGKPLTAWQEAKE